MFPIICHPRRPTGRSITMVQPYISRGVMFIYYWGYCHTTVLKCIIVYTTVVDTP